MVGRCLLLSRHRWFPDRNFRGMASGYRIDKVGRMNMFGVGTEVPEPLRDRVPGKNRLCGVLLIALLVGTTMINVAATEATGPMPFATPVLALVAFLVGRMSPVQRPVPLFFAAIVIGRSVPALLSGTGRWEGVADVVFTVLFGVLPWLTGRYLRQRADLLAAGWERAGLLEHQRNAFAEQERLRERARIAQDMHDSLGHELSLLAIRAGALEVGRGFTEANFRSAAGDLRADTTRAVERLQEIVGVLHEASDGGRPDREQGAGGDIAALTEHTRGAGMRLELVRNGTAPEQLPEAVGRIAYRVVREALTNAAKHAPGEAVTVTVDGGTDNGGKAGPSTVTVVNGSSSATRPRPPSGGRGLAALGECVEQAGGCLRAGPCGEGGFAVTAHIPHGEKAAAAGSVPGTESARRFAAWQSRASRGITAVIIPAGLVLALALGWYAYHGSASAGSVLTPSDYARLRVGQEQARTDTVLPFLRMPDPPVKAAPAVPDGAACEYYRSRHAPSDTRVVAYRVCFAEGRLVSKDVVPAGTQEGAP